MSAQVFTQRNRDEGSAEPGSGLVKEGVGQNTAAPLPWLMAGQDGSKEQAKHRPAGAFITSYYTAFPASVTCPTSIQCFIYTFISNSFPARLHKGSEVGTRYK